jgi:Ner family transcriptional regulator
MVVRSENSPSMSRQDRQLSGWHPEDVKAAIRKKGVTLTELALRNGFSESYLRNALRRPLHDGEQIIARFLKVPAEQIWPDRYDADGTPNYRKWRELQRMRHATRRRAA